MSKSDRNNPHRSASSESNYTFFDFQTEFPDDASCLEWLMTQSYPDGVHCRNCQRVTRHHRVQSRPSYSCQFCGNHVHPMTGTIFENSATSLRLWFHAIFLMSQTRCGISAKQLERELGVTYKTAWRMFHLIRNELMHQDDEVGLHGQVEADETYVGARRKGRTGRPGAADRGKKTPVFGMVERKGRVVALTVDNAKGSTLMPHMQKRVLPASTVYTDEWGGYNETERSGYQHRRINHSEGVYVLGDIHTNTIEGFWSLVKRGIAGTHHAVSAKHLQGYLNEYAFRYNRRETEVARGMFGLLLDRIVQHPAVT